MSADIVSRMSNDHVGNATCASCSKPSAEKHCAGCIGAPDLEGRPQQISYCNALCQKGHWQAHKQTCLALRQRKILFRAGDTAQRVFYLYRRELFDKKFKVVEHEGNDIVLHEEDYGDGYRLNPFEALEQCLEPFPDILFKEKRDKEAVLTHNACTDALAYIHQLIAIMLRGICTDINTDIKEQQVEVKNPKRHLKIMLVNGILDPCAILHQLLQIKLKSGEVYAFDISAAQHGYHDSVIPWDRYLEARVKTLEKSQRFGQAQSRLFHPPMHEREGWPGAIRSMNRIWCKNFEKYLRKSEARMPLTKILKLPDSSFSAAQEEFLNGVKHFFESFKKSYQGEDRFKMMAYAAEELMEEPKIHHDENGVTILTM